MYSQPETVRPCTALASADAPQRQATHTYEQVLYDAVDGWSEAADPPVMRAANRPLNHAASPVVVAVDQSMYAPPSQLWDLQPPGGHESAARPVHDDE